MQTTMKHPAPLDERCEDCGKYMLLTFDRNANELCAGHPDARQVA